MTPEKGGIFPPPLGELKNPDRLQKADLFNVFRRA